MIRSAVHILSSDGVGKKIGYIEFSDSPGGLLIEPYIEGLEPGEHGFHIHEIGDIEPKDGVAGGMAGQHYDPEGTGKHLGPYKNGHKGDLPVLYVDEDGIADAPVLAPRLMLKEVEGRAIIIHSGGDNYSDKPLKNGGGKSRIAGGVITNDCPYCKNEMYKKIGFVALAGLGLWALNRSK